MGQAFRNPKEYERRNFITIHAIERLIEYGTDVARAAADRVIGDLLDTEVEEGFRDKREVPYKDIKGDPCWLVEFTKEFWALPRVYMLVYKDRNPSLWHVRTVLTGSAVEDMLEKEKLVPRIIEERSLAVVPPPVEEPEEENALLRVLREEVQDLKQELERVEAENKALRRDNERAQAKIDRLARIHTAAIEVIAGEA